MKYLAYFASKNVEFRWPEIESVSKHVGVTLLPQPSNFTIQESPFVEFVPDHPLSSTLPLIQIANRSVSLFGLFEIWSSSSTFESLISSLGQLALDSPELFKPQRDGRSYKFVVEGYGHRFTYEQKISLMNQLAWLAWPSIDLANPADTFYLLGDYGIGSLPDALPRQVWFARLIGPSGRHLIQRFLVPNRMYIGTTSMEAEIALLTANQALARPGTWILDPFVGTGSLLLTCAHFGAKTFGFDIDLAVLQGTSEKKNIAANFKATESIDSLLGLIRLDLSQKSVFRKTRHGFLDAIVCDPPYGIRAGARKVGRRKKNDITSLTADETLLSILSSIKNPSWLPHVPQCIPYSFTQVLEDLLKLAANTLVIGGRLVYWLPTFIDEYRISDLPTHPLLRVVANSEQRLTLRWARRLITMEKIDLSSSPVDLLQQKNNPVFTNTQFLNIFKYPEMNKLRNPIHGPSKDSKRPSQLTPVHSDEPSQPLTPCQIDEPSQSSTGQDTIEYLHGSIILTRKEDLPSNQEPAHANFSAKLLRDPRRLHPTKS